MTNPLADELAFTRHVKPCVLVIFGATGDLTRRKLVPSLLRLAKNGLLPPGFSGVGFARRDKSREEFHRDLVKEVESSQAFKEGIYYHRSDFANSEGYASLKTLLEKIDRERGTQGNRIFYLATPPSAYSGSMSMRMKLPVILCAAVSCRRK